MIRSATIKNFKNILDQRINLDPLTVLVGANGSGKTSVLKAIELASHARRADPNWAISTRQQLGWSYTRGGTGFFLVGCATDDGRFSLQFVPPENQVAPSEPLQMLHWAFVGMGGDRKSFEESQSEVLPLST